MKINYKNTALGLIDDPANFNFGFPDPDITPRLDKSELRRFGNSLVASSEKMKLLCGNKIEYVATSFLEAFKKGSPKLKSLLHKEYIEDSGVLITGGESGQSHIHTIYYTVLTVYAADGSLFYNILYIDFSKHSKSDIPVLDAYVSTVLEPDLKSVDSRRLLWNGYLDEGRDAGYWEAFIIGFCLFKKYCDIDTKVIDPKKSRRGVISGKKYLNETDKRISVLDCTWFTNLVVSGAFGVSGHLHWYYYGPGKKQKKLIWVDEYQKKGYSRQAKILSQ